MSYGNVNFDIRLFDLCPVITKEITACKKGLVSFIKRFTQHEKQTKFWHGIVYNDTSKTLI